MNVLHVTPAFYPATYWGGPMFSTYALCNGVAAQKDIVLRVLTTDSAGPARDQRVDVFTYPMTYLAGYEVYFTRRVAGVDVAPGLVGALPKLVRWADVVHVTSAYSFPTIPTMLACRRYGRPLVWSPRGALQATEEWPDARRKSAKQAFEALLRKAMPPRAVMHVTAAVERDLSLKRMPGMVAVTIPNGVEIPTMLPKRVWRPQGRLRLMYMSRLDPKKGLENLLDAMKVLPERVTLDVYGTGDASYVDNLKAHAHRSGLASRAMFHGHVVGNAKGAAFSDADLVVLPSYSENFGMVVAEALAHGVPVVTSRATPWQEIERVGCGRWIENTSKQIFATILELMLADLEAMGERGRNWVEETLCWDGICSRFTDLYRAIYDGEPLSAVSRNLASPTETAASLPRNSMESET